MRFVKTAENLFGLPTGFQRVAYLESTGTQYIDTGYKPVPATTKFEIMFQCDSITDNTFIFGARPDTSATSQYTCTTYKATSKIRQDWAGSAEYFTGITTTDKYIYTAYNNTITLNDTTVTGTITRSTTRLDYNFLLFAVNTAGTADSRRYVGKVYYSKLWDDGVLVRDFIPCIDSLGVPCMYDLVGKKPYYNQGTGEFTVGRQIIPVEYLESTGTQYIDTGIIMKSTNKIECRFQALSATTGNARNYIFGADTVATGVQYSYSSSTFFGVAGRYQQNDVLDMNTDIHLAEVYDGKIYLDGVSLTLDKGTGANPYTSTKTIHLFGFNDTNGHTNPTVNDRVYYYKMWDNNVLIQDLIPAKDSNDVGFMFDTLSGTVYENAGTGAFVVGGNKYNMKLRLIRDNILPTGYTQLEYIEADNRGSPIIVQYAVGNYRLTNTTDWEITFTASAPSNNWVMGQPTWIGVHYRKDATTGNLPRVGIANSAASSSQCYVDYTDNEKITLALKGADVYANGVKAGSITRVSAGATQTKFGIFAYKDINQDLPNLRIQSAKIYRLKIWDNDVLVQDLIPAMKDGVAGFYERVNKTFIEKESNSTADFTTGKPVLPVVRFPVDPVPVGYKTVNYLESTGSQYIDTGVDIGAEIESEFSFYATAFNGSTYCSPLSARRTNQINSISYAFNNGTTYASFGNNAEVQILPTISLNTKHAIIQNKEGLWQDGNKTNYAQGYNTNFTETGHLYVFARNNIGSSVGNYFIGRIYYAKIYDNNTLIRNFIPVIRLLDNKAGMWDTVTKQFYTTPTGDFITG